MKSKILIYSGLLLIFFFSANLEIYKYLKFFLGRTESYLVEQLIFYMILFTAVGYGFLTKKIKFGLTELLVLILFLLLPFISHSEILQRYFYKEDFFYNLSALRVSDTADFYYPRSYFIIYPFLPMVIVYSFFKGAVGYYNFFTLILLSTSAFLLYLLNVLILPKRNNYIKILSLLVSLIYLTSPTYLDSYLWVSAALEGGFTYSLMLCGLIFYVLYFKRGNGFYFLCSYLVLLALLKTGFARAGFLPLVYILFEMLFLLKKNFVNFLMRIVLIFVPTILFLYNSEYLNKIFYLSGESDGLKESIYLLFAYLTQALLPYEVLLMLYTKFQESALSQISPFDFNFYFGLGLITITSFIVCFFIISNKVIARYGIFFIISALICLFFFVKFGSMGRIGVQDKFDASLSKYAVTIGHRYYQGVNILFNVSIFILIAVFTLKYPRTLFISSLILTTIIVYNISIIKTHNKVFIHNYASHNRAFYEGMLRLVPADNNKKILYLINGDKWKGRLHTFENYLIAFYPPDTLLLVNNKDDFMIEIKKGEYKRENIYLVYFDEQTLVLKDQTSEYRDKLLVEDKNIWQ